MNRPILKRYLAMSLIVFILLKMAVHSSEKLPQKRDNSLLEIIAGGKATLKERRAAIEKLANRRSWKTLIQASERLLDSEIILGRVLEGIAKIGDPNALPEMERIGNILRRDFHSGQFWAVYESACEKLRKIDAAKSGRVPATTKR